MGEGFGLSIKVSADVGDWFLGLSETGQHDFDVFAHLLDGWGDRVLDYYEPLYGKGPVVYANLLPPFVREASVMIDGKIYGIFYCPVSRTRGYFVPYVYLVFDEVLNSYIAAAVRAQLESFIIDQREDRDG